MATKTKQAEQFLTLAQAAEVTGSSRGRFRYNEDRLRDLGAVITDTGWAIPTSALVELGWLARDAAVQVSLTPLQVAEARIRELEAEVTALREKQGGSIRRLFGGK